MEKMTNDELMKIFDYILENPEIVISEDSDFTRDTLITIRSIVNGKIENSFILSKEQEEMLIKTFLKGNNYFNIDTPKIIIINSECIKVALKNDINSADFLIEESIEDIEFIILETLSSKYILKEYSANFLKRNVYVALHSISLDINSADYIDWDNLEESDRDILIEEIIKRNYKLSKDSHEFLKKNLKLVLQQIKKDIDSIIYASEEMREVPQVFDEMILNNYPCPGIRKKPLKYFHNSKVLGKSLKKINGTITDDNVYLERLNTLLTDAINRKPLIKDFDQIFDYITETEWEEYREEEQDYYNNIFGKILSVLRTESTLSDAIYTMNFLSEMEDILKDKWIDLKNTLKEYHEIYHSSYSDKLSKLEKSQDIIAKLSALYIAKSKEKFKKEFIKEKIYPDLYDYYILNLDNPYVKKKLIEAQQKKSFISSYKHKDLNIKTFLKSIEEKYSNSVNSLTIKLLITSFLDGKNHIDEILTKPEFYDEYIAYEKTLKLINRLNNGHIEYGGTEVKHFKHLIGIDYTNNKYFYIGKHFTDEEISAYYKYSRLSSIFSKIKKDIMLEAQKIEIDLDEIDEEIYDNLLDELPFTDEYFIFDPDFINDIFTLDDLSSAFFPERFKLKLKSLKSNESFNNVYNFILNNNIIWLLLFINRYELTKLMEYGIEKQGIADLIYDMPNLLHLANNFNFNLNNIRDLFFLRDVNDAVSEQTLAILDNEIIDKLYKNTEYTNSQVETKIIHVASELVCHMTKRHSSTVPYVSGSTLNYKYSMYDSLDQSLLVSGIDTNSCFKVMGIDNDFFHYCALNKNGFVIKILDHENNFIGRASGFRNGNCIFLNQLRTIYDHSGNYYTGDYESEKNDIIQTLIEACQSIINTSQNNVEEKHKIDNVFITTSYILKDYTSNISTSLINYIGSNPMQINEADWIEFKNYPHIQNKDIKQGFTTDYGGYPLICLATSNKKLNILKLKFKDVPALYERKRNMLSLQYAPDSSSVQKINRIKAIETYFTGREYMPYTPPDNALIISGDNWYIVYYKSEIINSCLLEFDDKAKLEFEATKRALKQQKIDKNSIEFEIEQATTTVQPSKQKHKILSFKKN